MRGAAQGVTVRFTKRAARILVVVSHDATNYLASCGTNGRELNSSALTNAASFEAEGATDLVDKKYREQDVTSLALDQDELVFKDFSK